MIKIADLSISKISLPQERQSRREAGLSVLGGFQTTLPTGKQIVQICVTRHTPPHATSRQVTNLRISGTQI